MRPYLMSPNSEFRAVDQRGNGIAGSNYIVMEAIAGGSDDLAALNREGKLDPLLGL